HAVDHRDSHRHHPRRAVDHRAPHRCTPTRPRDLPPAGARAPAPAQVLGARREGGCGMSTATMAPEQAPVIVPPVKWRAPGFMIAFTLVSLFGFALFTQSGDTTFRTATGSEATELPNTVVPTVPALWVLTLVMAALAAYATVRAVRREPVGWWPPAIFGTVFFTAFLTWVGAGRTIPLTSLLLGGLALSVPLVFGALSGVMCERSGVINIAIEGQLLAGAFLSAVVASIAGNPYIGVVAAPIAGALV